MPRLRLWYDLRRAPGGPSHRELYAAALDQCAWADGAGFEQVTFGEHHGADDGYLPSPVTFAAAAAARTSRMRVRPVAVAPLRSPVRLAEDLAVVDIVSGGRLTVVLLAGYVEAEFTMVGRSMHGRRQALAAAVGVLRAAWTGEPFEHDGRTVVVRPVPVQQPSPPLVLGGSTKVSALDAARLADGYDPVDRRLWPVYRAERQRLGHPDPGAWPAYGPTFLHVSRDPEVAWRTLVPYLLHGVNAYAALLGRPAVDEAALRGGGAFRVVHPDDAVELAAGMDDDGVLELRPLFGGLPPDEAERSLGLFADHVLPYATR